ncbi:hypothetical protein BO226_25770 (plasmid) [Rhodococcus sp. 2G]|nr:hypothetical protein BO226_25770 [Rhodococcus sp. 2G]
MCSGGAITLTGNDSMGAQKQVLGNIDTGQAIEITGTAESERKVQLDQLGVAPIPTIQVPEGEEAPEMVPFDVGDPCFPGDGEDVNYITGKQSARANMQVCYGEYIWMGGAPLEIVWSDWLTYEWSLVLRNRYNHEVAIKNTTLSNRTIDVTVGWDVRKDVFGPDEEIASDTWDETLWQHGNVSNFSYTIEDGNGRYFMTQRQIVIEDYATASIYPGVLNHELPRFTCPASSTSLCTYDGAA